MNAPGGAGTAAGSPGSASLPAACSGGRCLGPAAVSGLVSVRARPDPSAGGVRLLEQGFELAERRCGTVDGKRVCISAGLAP